ncbi:MAG: stage III sporulation protein AA [Eubacteriales bacterium]|nr:stage III sporulation protein AA [Eubacteriales bacterium]
MNIHKALIQIFSENIRLIVKKMKIDAESLQEIRMRVEKPFLILADGEEYFVTEKGELTKQEQKGYIVTKQEIMETISYITHYSLYAYEDEVRQGFLTIEGGHRIGIAGKMVMEGNRIKNIKYISFLNIRITHEKKGCADKLLPYIIDQGRICHTLLVSPPRGGKTTILRDLVRQLSNGTKFLPGVTVGVVDERSEIGGSYMGVPQNDLGIRTDVLDCCPKAEGMMMLIRSMSPHVIAVDEIGDYEDSRAIEAVMNCGCKVLATVHGSSIEDIQKKPLLQQMVTQKVFERYVILGNLPGKIKEIFDERGTRLYQEGVDLC